MSTGYYTRASLVAQMVKRLPAMRETRVRSLGQEDPLEKKITTHSSTLAWKIPWTEEPGRLQSMGSQRVRHDWATSLSLSNMSTAFRGGSVVKNPPANAGDEDLIPGLRRSPGEGNGNPLQYSCLGKNPMDRGGWQATVPWYHRRVRHDLGTNQQQESHGWGTWWATVHGVAKSWTQLSDFTFIFKYVHRLPWWLSGKESTCQCRRWGFDPWAEKIPWRRKWQPTPVFLPRQESHGLRNLVGYSPWGRKQSDTTERIHFHFLSRTTTKYVCFLILRTCNYVTLHSKGELRLQMELRLLVRLP